MAARSVGGWDWIYCEFQARVNYCPSSESGLFMAYINNVRVSYYLGHVICYLYLSEPGAPSDMFGKYDGEEEKIRVRAKVLEQTGH